MLPLVETQKLELLALLKRAEHCQDDPTVLACLAVSWLRHLHPVDSELGALAIRWSQLATSDKPEAHEDLRQAIMNIISLRLYGIRYHEPTETSND